jgi:hypothetical protein
MADQPIYVTQPSLAPLGEYTPYLEQIWASGVMTHNGPLLQRLEAEVTRLLGVKHTVCLNNGTLALQLAIRALDLRGEIITTPFTYAATASAIDWEHCTPVFVDIDPDTWNLDPRKIEAAITKHTVGIMPVHVFSAPCDVVAINMIAQRYGLKVIYDAAHAMCVNIDGQSVMTCGDISCTSFHATKLFNTCEGGACFTEDDELAARLRRMRFFGHDASKELTDSGTNAKLTEIHAALGLANLPYIPQVLDRRRACHDRYHERLADLRGVRFQKCDSASYNYSYMPVLMRDQATTVAVVAALVEKNIHPRRYFHPALHTTPAYANCPREDRSVAEDVASRVLCLPTYYDLSLDQVDRICDVIAAAIR